ncbi:MAG: ABC transporter substrate-binding protein, partial [Actinomycetota bacterium]|nr:ABC transporter substrate-binding protein [Actinomycetota bacterium]
MLHLPAGDFGYTPFNYLLGPGYVRMSLLFDTLIWKDSQGYIPWLATEWKQSADGKAWTFTLRPGVKWHDGTPLTVDDIVFTFDYFKKQPPTSPLLRGLEFVSGARKVDAQHVEVALTQVYAPFLVNIAGALPIIPQHVWEKVADPTTFTAPEAAIGSGPYKLTSYDAASGAYGYDANNDFWLGKPFVQRIEMVPTGDDLLALKQGTLDAADVSAPSGVTDDVLAQFQAPDYGVLNQLLEFSPVIHFNLAKGAPYTDVNFRRAWAYAIDRDELVQRVLQGKGKPGNPGWLGPASSWYNPAVEQYKFDPAKAKALLDSAGYKDRNGDGMRELPNGKPLDVHILGGGGPFARVTELIVAQLKSVGIKASFTSPGDPNALIEQFARGNYDVGLLFYELGGDPDYMRQV